MYGVVVKVKELYEDDGCTALEWAKVGATWKIGFRVWKVVMDG